MNDVGALSDGDGDGASYLPGVAPGRGGDGGDGAHAPETSQSHYHRREICCSSVA